MPGEEERYVKSDTGGAIPGPKVPRSGSSRSDIPNFGVLGDDIDPRNIQAVTIKNKGKGSIRKINM